MPTRTIDDRRWVLASCLWQHKVVARDAQHLSLDLRNVTKRYAPDAPNAVDGIDLAVSHGEIFGLLGPNGAGKTTTIGIATTRVRPSAGTVIVTGVDVRARPAVAKRHIGVVTQFNTLDRACTVEENLYFHGRFFGMSRRTAHTRAASLLTSFGMRDRGRTMVAELSGGLARRTQLACALMHHPDVLFLDEPTTGLDPQSRIALWESVRSLREAEGMAVVLTTHYIEEADALCDRVAVMNNGKILVCDTPEQIKRDSGDGVLVTLRLREASPALVAQLRALEGVDAVDPDHDVIRVHVTGADGIVPHVVALAGADLRDLAIAEPSLETAFIALTGRALVP
jgi:ABC-2 type transport system ATP-binding protein